MKRKILACLLAIVFCLSLFPLTAFADDEIPSDFDQIATYYYDKSNPYNNGVHGNSDYAYVCYVNFEKVGLPHCIFVHNGKIVTDNSLITALSKMYFANNWQKHPMAVANLEKAKTLIEISDGLKVNAFVDGLTTLASECLGTLMSIYATGGSATSAEILKVIGDQTAEVLKERLFDVSKVISKLQIKMLHAVAGNMEYQIERIRNMGGESFMYYQYCEEFCDVFSQLERLIAAECILVSNEVEKLEPSLIKNLAHYFGIAANSFVGGFSDFLKDLDAVEQLKNSNPEYIAQAIELAIKLQDIKDTLSDIEDFKEIFETTAGETQALFDVFEAYDAYNSKKASSLDTVVTYSLAFVKDLQDDANNGDNSSGDDDTPSDTSNTAEAEFAKKIQALRAEYPQDYYWNKYNGIDSEKIAKAGTAPCKGKANYNNKSCVSNGYCAYGGVACSCDCGYFHGWQCFGFGNLLCYKTLGSWATDSYYSSGVNSSAGWKYCKSVSEYYAGDFVRINNSHTIFIYRVDSDTAYYAECNATGACKINWNGKISLSSLKSKTTFVVHKSGNDLKGVLVTAENSVQNDRIATDFYANLKDGIYTFKSFHSGKYMAVEGAKNANGTNVLTYDYQNTDAFKFYIQHVENGKYLIYSLASKSGSTYERVLDVWTGVYEGTPEHGDKIDIYERTSTEDKCQLFYIVPMSNGTYVIELVSVPGLVVASKNAENASTEGGAMTARNYKGYTTQQWYLCDGAGERVDASIDAPTGKPIEYTTGVFKVTPNIGLNMRSGPGTEHFKVGAIPQNTSITITKVNGSWGWTSYNGVPGWVCMDYLKKTGELNDANVQATIPTPTFSGASITLQNNLAVNFKVNESFFTLHGYESPYVVFELNGDEITVADYSVIDGKYVFTFKNIAPNKMADTITAILYVRYEDDVFVTCTKQYSITQYCYSILEKYSSDEYAELRTLLVDLLDYGAASQLHTNYKCENLANKNLTSEQKLWATQDEPTLNTIADAQYKTVDEAKTNWKGVGLLLNDSITLRFKFSAESIENLSVRVQIASHEYVISADQFVQSDDMYYVCFNELTASQMSEEVYITVYEGDVAVSDTARYSVESYAYEKQDSDVLHLATLVKAMMKYGNSARAYIDN